jgi:hypothetical protein
MNQFFVRDFDIVATENPFSIFQVPKQGFIVKQVQGRELGLRETHAQR